MSSGDPLNASGGGDDDDLDALLAQADSMISSTGSGGGTTNNNVVIDGFAIDSDEDDEVPAAGDTSTKGTGSSGEEDDIVDVSMDSPQPVKATTTSTTSTTTTNTAAGNAPKVPIQASEDPLLHPLHEDVVHTNNNNNNNNNPDTAATASHFPASVTSAMGAMRNLHLGGAVAGSGGSTDHPGSGGGPAVDVASLESQFKAQTSRFAANFSTLAQRVASAVPTPTSSSSGAAARMMMDHNYPQPNYPQPPVTTTPGTTMANSGTGSGSSPMYSSTGSLNNNNNNNNSYHNSSGTNSPHASQTNSAHGMANNTNNTTPQQPIPMMMMMNIELDAEQKTALVELHVGKLLPGEKVIMFLHNLLHVSDSTGFQYVANTAAGSNGGFLGGTAVWCCAMTYYRLILFGTTQEMIVHVMNTNTKTTTSTSTTNEDATTTTTTTTPPTSAEQSPPPFLKHPFGAPPDWNASCWPPAYPTVLELPLACMEKVEKTVYTASAPTNHSDHHGGGSGSSSMSHAAPSTPAAAAASQGRPTTLMGLQVWAKHGRVWRLTTTSYADTMRAHQALLTYAFPGRRNLGYLFAFESKRVDVVNSVVTDPTTGQKTVSLALVRKRFDAVTEFQRQFRRYTTTNSGGDAGSAAGGGAGGGDANHTTTPKVQPWKIWTGLNSQYQLCMSYPSVLVGPASLDEHNPDAVRLLQSCAAFRSEQRLPALSWASGMDGASIWRCSQPKIGLQGNRSSADELVLKHIMEAAKSANALREQPLPVRMNAATMAAFTGANDLANSHWVKEAHCALKILDLRPRSAAMANRTGGYGYENTSNYPGTTLQFCNIGNIHAVRDSYQKMTALCLNMTNSTDVNWGSALEDTKWLSHIRIILAASWETAFWVHVHRMPVLVHCSHGWDRTSQVSALAQLMLDPYYRTMEGFACLIEKDFMSFGHPFHTRCAHGEGKGGSGGGGVHHQDGVGGAGGIVGSSSDVNSSADEGQISPIFLQFLDCVWQIVHHFPECFEFTTEYLLELGDHIYSCRFGNMLCDTERERELVAGIRQRTYSLWDYLEQNPEDPNSDPNAKLWRNKHYDPSPNAGGGVLLMPLPTLLRNVTLWKDRHTRFGPKATLRWRNTEHSELWQPRPTESPAPWEAEQS